MESQEAQKQLDLIEQTIQQAKRSFYKGSAQYLIWGWALFLAALAQFFMIWTETALQYHWTPWPILSIVAGVGAWVHERSRGKERKEPTDRIFAFLWSAFGITLFLSIFGMVSMKLDPNPFVILLMGLPTFTSGGILRSKALLIGGAMIWGTGLVACFLDLPMTSLAFAMALLFGYVIPGHVLRGQERKQKELENA